MHKLITTAVAVVLTLLFASNVQADTGGPDAGGYRYIDSNEPDGPEFSNVLLIGTPISIDVGDADDGVDTGVPIGFPFTYYGESYDTVNISTNGNLQFTTSSTSPDNDSIPSATIAGPAIFPFWDDLVFEGCGSIITANDPDPEGDRRFFVSWNVCHQDADIQEGCNILFRLILHERTGEILMLYPDTTFSCNGGPETPDDGASASVGTQRDGSVGLQYSFNEAALSEELAICFYPDGEIDDPFCAPASVDDDVCDFAIVKTNDLADPNDLTVGQTFTWTLDVSWDADCDDVVFDVLDDIPEGFSVLGVTPIQGDALELSCNAIDPVLCDNAMTSADAGSAAVEIEVEVTAQVCAVENVAFVTPDDDQFPDATGASATDTVSSADCGGITVFKSCPFGAGQSTFQIEKEDANGLVLDSDGIECGGTESTLGLPAGDYTVRELIDGPDAAEFTTLISCDGSDPVSGTEAAVTVPAGVTVVCVVVNSLGEDVGDLVCPCGFGSIEIDNTNTNVIGIDNDNTNNNANTNDNRNENENDNENVNNNANTNTQDQDNDQDQDNENEQTNNIDASPEVNIDLD